MEASLLQSLSNAAATTAQIAPSNQDERAIVGFLVGAIYSLRKALELGFFDRTGTSLSPEYTNELKAVATILTSSADLSDERAWLSGFYFNSGLQRIAAGSERATRHVFGGRMDICSELGATRGEVNRLKHEIDGLLNGRSITPAKAVSALCALVDFCAFTIPVGKGK